ncbi:MAG: neutral/alkaline non-lysosomal ceramidase N-terminal domain-containing protein [Chitinophagaceae bacterium]|nr:neutral/alkaline non-lysosomal ceramidase N-terminal domain-containing protein [Chitinophagaceae bacterium]
MKKNNYKLISTFLWWLITMIFLSALFSFDKIKEADNLINGKIHKTISPAEDMEWLVGISRRVLTPTTDVWLAGYGTKRPVEGKLHDIWVKILALKSKNGKRAVMVTTDNQGMSRTIYENLYKKIHERFQLDRSEFMLTFSHNHSGTRLRGDLVDYYPSDDAENKIVDEYSDWMEGQIIDAMDEALKSMQPAQISKGEGLCTFAVNRRDNVESEVPALLAAGEPLKGVTDHYVPVLSVKNTKGDLIAILFGYACHPTTLRGNLLGGDYPGFAQINLEARYPGVTAMFFNACGGDQNPLPRRTVELCEKYGKMLSDAVEEVVAKPMQPVSSRLQTAFKFVKLDYEEVVTKEKLLPITTGDYDVHARWARRMLRMIDKGVQFPESYNYYPVQAWQLGKELLLIGTGGESVVDYSLRFKREFGEGSTWVLGYTNTMVAYIPSRRVWEEGGYEGGPHLDEYGHPAWRWAGNVEDRVANGVHHVVKQVHKH